MAKKLAFGLRIVIPLAATAYLLRAGLLRMKQEVVARIAGFKKAFAVIID